MRGSFPILQHQLAPCPGTGYFGEGEMGFTACKNINRPNFFTDSDGNADLIIPLPSGSNPCAFPVTMIKAAGYQTILATENWIDTIDC